MENETLFGILSQGDINATHVLSTIEDVNNPSPRELDMLQQVRRRMMDKLRRRGYRGLYLSPDQILFEDGAVYNADDIRSRAKLSNDELISFDDLRRAIERHKPAQNFKNN